MRGKIAPHGVPGTFQETPYVVRRFVSSEVKVIDKQPYGQSPDSIGYRLLLRYLYQ